MKAEGDFGNIVKILNREKPDRPTLFEFFMNGRLYLNIVGSAAKEIGEREYGWERIIVGAFHDPKGFIDQDALPVRIG